MPPRHPYLCIAVVMILGVALLASIVGIVVIETYERTAPPSLVAFGGAALGALAAYLASVPPPRAPS